MTCVKKNFQGKRHWKSIAEVTQVKNHSNANGVKNQTYLKTEQESAAKDDSVATDDNSAFKVKCQPDPGHAVNRTLSRNIVETLVI